MIFCFSINIYNLDSFFQEAVQKSLESGLHTTGHHVSINEREPSQSSHTSKETVIDRFTSPEPQKPKPTGDDPNIRTVNVEVLPQSSQRSNPKSMVVALATTPPPYGKPVTIMKRRSSGSDIKPPTPPVETATCIEVRDCACQTRDSFLARLNMGRQYFRKSPLALEEEPPIRRVRFPHFTYAASSASSETGRSLERLDELSE